MTEARGNKRRRSCLLAGLLITLALLVGHDLHPYLPAPPLPAHPPAPAPYVAPDAGLRFVDVARKAGLRYRWAIPRVGALNILQGIGNGCAFLDYDNDGDLDILLVGPKLALFRGDGRGHFTDVTHAVGLDRLHGHFLGCAVGDYDNDGYDDIYISGYRTGLLLHNEHGNRFTDVTRQSGLPPASWALSAAWADIDGDGRLDLFVCDYLVYPPPARGVRPIPRNPSVSQKPSVPASLSPSIYPPLRGMLYRNRGGGRFAPAPDRWHVRQGTGYAMAVACADIADTGRQSVYVGNDGVQADLLENTGQTFVNSGRRSGVGLLNGRPYSGMGADWGDYDNDGRPDLAVGTFAQQPKLVFHNDGGGLFTRKDDALGMDPRGSLFLSFGTKWLDGDNDGWLDLVFANGHIVDFLPGYRQPLQLFHNEQGRRLTDVTGASGLDLSRPIVGRGLAVGDYDNDGREDILVVDGEGAPLLLHNETPHAGHWLALRLIGTHSNRDAYGARVTARLPDGRVLTRWCHTDGSYLSASDRRVHFGLGRALTADITVRWPSGHVTRAGIVHADRVVTLRE